MSRKAQPHSSCLNFAATSAYVPNPTGYVLLAESPLKSAALQRKRKVAQRQDSGTAGANGFAKLTQREKEVMRLLAHGLLYKEIADELGISYSAVHKHQHNIFKKFGLNNRSEATRKWLEAGGL